MQHQDVNWLHYGAAGRDKEEVRKDVGRNRYFTPEQAIE